MFGLCINQLTIKQQKINKLHNGYTSNLNHQNTSEQMRELNNMFLMKVFHMYTWILYWLLFVLKKEIFCQNSDEEALEYSRRSEREISNTLYNGAIVAEIQTVFFSNLFQWEIYIVFISIPFCSMTVWKLDSNLKSNEHWLNNF